ncbi:MAG: nitrous oxide reductase accessory protein NosL [Ignavibacteriae bacterium]|nr:nitrous oxide reductase accessory protein NosL [Ignavibacteriota bacterium]
MSRTSRLLMAAAAALLATTFFLPLWSITLEAPQYPEGIGMNIYLHTVAGVKPNDLDNINGLNHYIGMKKIQPDSIAELRYMPSIMGGMLLLAAIAAVAGRRWLVLTWVLLFLGVAIAGLVDYYQWGYDYGHDLDPRAIIKIPGMSYQPPLIGSEQILNFTAHSWPGLGGIAAGLSILLGTAAWFVSRRGRGPVPAAAVLVCFLPLLFTGCSQGPRDIDMGREACANCSMTITDARFAAELVTSTSKVYVFDAIECLAAYINDAKVNEADIASLWTMRHDAPGTFTDAAKAWYLRADGIQSPMGMHLAAFENEPAFSEARKKEGGELLRWTGVRLRVAKEWDDEDAE